MSNSFTPQDTYVTLVTGLPRSGTSMIMRMLEAGGMPVLCDGVRAADEGNPHGYYEFEPVKRTRQDSSWLAAAGGMAVKMVYRLVYDLPCNHLYRTIVVERALSEVLASQRRMLERQTASDDATDEQMSALFEAEMIHFAAWIGSQPNFTAVTVNYNQLLCDPVRHLQRVNAFLGGNLNVPAMAEVLDPSLYRNRRS
jgi:hypothetical protein